MGKKILVSGSREITAKMETIVRAVMYKIWYRGNNTILVGDASGVDALVIEWAQKLHIPYLCVTPHSKPRNLAALDNFMTIKPDMNTLRSMPHSYVYTYRDRWMVDEADHVICIWNGHSKGTRNVYEYALMNRKPAEMHVGRMPSPYEHLVVPR
jgi:hypothetical protein